MRVGELQNRASFPVTRKLPALTPGSVVMQRNEPGMEKSFLLFLIAEYRGNRRHLESVNRGPKKTFVATRCSRTTAPKFARECGVKQAQRFQVVMSGEQKCDLPSEDLYWGSFTTLPQVEDTFTDVELSEICRPNGQHW